MGVTTDDIFGSAPRGEPATEGSYGEAPAGYRLPAGTQLGEVHLQVRDLATSLRFYEGVLGLERKAVAEREATLGAVGDARALVVLHEGASRPPAGRRGRLGLYHFAILLPTRESLGAFVRHLNEIGARAGAGDHLVSEAFYLSDPDGLGIEVYADRPRSAWQRSGRQLMMATDPVDVLALLRDAESTPWEGMPAGTVMGHVHLHVGSIEGASDFYSEAIGFDRIVWSYPGALFLAAGGYHHHLGTNTWAGPTAAAAGEDEPRLKEWTIVLPDAEALEGVRASLTSRGAPIVSSDATHVVTRDPWGTQVRLLIG